MQNRTVAILLSITLAVAFVLGLFIQPSESQANPGTGWRGEYFTNKTLSGTPALVATDDQISFNWAESAPKTGIPADGFSVRWTASPNFVQGGLYRFRTGADDGIRLYIDGVLLVDEFEIGGFRTFTRDVQLNAGIHNLRVDYFDDTGFAGALVDWALIVAGSSATAVPAATITPVASLSPTPKGAVDSLGRPLAHVATGRLNVRANPSINAARITQISLYQSYPILGISPDGSWYLIELRDGRSGWVSARYIYRVDHRPVPVVQVSLGSEATVPNIEVAGVATAELKIRVFPRTGEQIGILPRDTLVRVLARNSSGSWFYVSANGIEGWVYSPYIRLTNGRVMDLVIR